MSSKAFRYYRQQRDYWCGPAVLQMALAAHHISVAQSRLARLLQTKQITGTRRNQLVRTAKYFGLTAHARHAQTWSELSRLVPAYFVIVNYVEPEDEGHYAVVTRVLKDQIVLADPWHGATFRLSKKIFVSSWRQRQQWSLLISVE